MKSISVDMPLHQINKSVIEEIERLTRNNKGNSMLKFNVTDKESNRNIKLFSRNTRINVDDEFLAFFESHPGIDFRIN